MKHIIIGLMILALSAAPVAADGEKTRVCTSTYGGGVECKEVETIKETVTRHDVTAQNTGVVDNVILAGSFFVAGYLLFLLAKRYELIK